MAEQYNITSSLNTVKLTPLTQKGEIIDPNMTCQPNKETICLS